MKLLRTVLSALCILAGALSIVGWAISSVAVDAVEDGSAVIGLTDRALDSQAVQESIAGSMTDEVAQWFAEKGLDLDDLGAVGVVQELFQSMVETEAFKTLVTEQAEAARQQIAEALTDEARSPGPLVIVVDADSLVAEKLDGVAILGSVSDAIDIAPVQVVVMDAETFEQAREAYRLMGLSARFGLWVGIALVVIGLLVSPRRAWFLPKLLLAVGVFALGAWGIVQVMGIDGVTAVLPGGDDGAVGSVVGAVLTEESGDLLVQRALWVGVVALVAAGVLALVARMLNRRE